MPNCFSVASTANTGVDVTIIVLMFLLTVATIATAVWLLARFINAEKGGIVVKYVALSVAAGAVIRLLFAAFIGGNRYDFIDYNTAIDYFAENGVFYYYYKAGVEIYPLSFYMIALFGGIGRALGLASGSAWLMFLVKIPFVVADVCSAVILYKLGKKYVNPEVGSVLAALYSLCPVFIAASGIYGSAITLVVPFVLGSFAMIVEKKHLTAIILYSVAMLTAKEALYLYPIYLIYYGYLFVRAIVASAKYRKVADKTPDVKPADTDLIYKLPLYLFGAFLFKYVISLPLIAKDYNANPFRFIYRVFLQPLASLKYFSYNGLSIYNILGKNAESINVTFPNVAFTVCFGVPLLGAYVLFTLVSYFPDSTPMSVIPMLALLILSFIYTKDRRVLQVFGVVAIACVLTSMSAMAYGGYFNMLDLKEFTSTSYVGSPALSSGPGLVIVIFSSIISVAAHLYFTFAAFDITMSNNRKLLTGKKNIGYFEGVARLFR